MDGIIRIDKVVASYEVWLDAAFPFAKMKVKVLQRGTEDFAAFPNLARRDPISRNPDYTCGLGGTADAALNDLLTRFVAEVREHLPSNGYTPDDFEWSAHEDF